MKVLVTGGTGFIGRKLLRALHEKKHAIRVLSRAGKAVEKRFVFPVEGVAWSAESDLPLSALEGIDAVIHLAGEGIADKRWSEERKKKILDSRVVGTRRLIASLQQATSRPKIFIGASAIGFYGDRGDEPLTEDSAPGTGFLSFVCQEWEKAYQDLPADVRKCLVRIGVVLGRGGGALKPLLPLFQWGVGGKVGSGNQWMSWIHVEDLVNLFLSLLEAPSASGIFNGVSPKPVQNKEFSKALGHAVHRPAILPAPALALKIAMGEMSELVLGSQRVMPQRALEIGFRCQFESIESALEDIVKKSAVPS